MVQKQDEFPVHISVSNQSLDVKTISLEISLDGQEVFSREMQTGTQHNWEQLTLRVAAGRHTLEVAEAKTGARRTHQLDLSGESNLVITFQAPPPRIEISEPGGQIGFI